MYESTLLGEKVLRSAGLGHLICPGRGIRDPEDVEPQHDLWAEYRLDIRGAFADALSWETFRRKWCRFLDDDCDVPLPLNLRQAWHRAIRDMSTLKALVPVPRRVRFIRTLVPQVFASVAVVLALSRSANDHRPVPPWGAAFRLLADLGYLKAEDRFPHRVYVDEVLLSQESPGESPVAPDTPDRSVILQALRSEPLLRPGGGVDLPEKFR